MILQNAYGHRNPLANAKHKLDVLSQGLGTSRDFMACLVEFQLWATKTSWNYLTKMFQLQGGR